MSKSTYIDMMWGGKYKVVSVDITLESPLSFTAGTWAVLVDATTTIDYSGVIQAAILTSSGNIFRTMPACSDRPDSSQAKWRIQVLPASSGSLAANSVIRVLRLVRIDS